MNRANVIQRSYDPGAAGAASANNPIPDWQTGKVYSVGDDVENAGALYKCLAGHTAGATFITDWDAGSWQLQEDLARVKTKTAAYSMAGNDKIILADASGGSFTVTLPTAASALAGNKYTIKRTDSVLLNSVNVAPPAGLSIDGGGAVSLGGKASRDFLYDGTNYQVV